MLFLKIFFHFLALTFAVFFGIISLMNKLRFLSGNSIKILAALAMVIDHVGLLFFPFDPVFRMIGRLALPLFAYMIAEGCKYTKNKLKYLLLMAGMGTVCQIVYYLYNGSLDMCVLVTFSLSILIIYALQFVKKCTDNENGTLGMEILSAILLVGALAFAFAFCARFNVDYGFFGCLLPVFIALGDTFAPTMPEKNVKAQSELITLLKLLLLAVGLWLLAKDVDWDLQYYSFFALIILFFYNQKRGKWRMKYFFYLFYPLHLAALQGLYMYLMTPIS